jgi:hypothetical protein
MGEFFKGWRRKTALVALAFACVLASGWKRSLSSTDSLQFAGGYNAAGTLVSWQGSLVWIRLNKVPSHGLIDFYNDVMCFPEWHQKSPSANFDLFAAYKVKWRWCCFGCGIGDTGAKEAVLLVVSYWFITVPLTLISCWLLLSKPGKSIQKKITEPSPGEGK